MGGTVVLNASYEVLTIVPWQRAVVLVVGGQAEVHEADETRMVRSQTLAVPYPKVIRLLRYVYVKFTDRRVRMANRVSKRGVLERDVYQCAYCGKKGDTVDHVIPQSRGGKDSWDNLVTACSPCNHAKDNRTPEEAGMRLLWQPFQPDRVGRLQRQVWKGLATAVA